MANSNAMEELPDSKSFVPTAYSIRMVSLGFDQLLADCYWLQFVSYVGNSKERAEDKYKLAYDYLDLITGLDPYMVNAYWFAAFTLGSEQKRPQLAEELIERGIRANQDNWNLPFVAGINQFLYAHNETAAAKYYRMASRYPDAPSWLGRQAKILEARIPSSIKEINIWTNIYSSTSDSRVKELARQKLIDLWGAILAKHPPKDIRDKAANSLKELGVNLDFFLSKFK